MSRSGSVQERIDAIRTVLPSPLCTVITISNTLQNDNKSAMSIINKSLQLCSSLLSDTAKMQDSAVIAETLDDLDILKEYIWEELNIGHWKNTPKVFRFLFSCVSLLKVILICFDIRIPLSEAIKECDVGLLLGEPITDSNILSKLAFRLHVLIQSDRHENDLNDDAENNEQQRLDTKKVNASDCDKTDKTDFIFLNQYQHRLYIDTVQRPSIEKFVQEYFNPQKPTLLTNIIDHWPAREKWTVQYIRQLAGKRTVPIEIGSKYTSEEWTQKLVTMEHFVDNFILNTPSSKTSVGYLAQHQLFHQIPELMEDILIPEYCYVGSSSNIDINAWFGPAGTVSPTHYDPKHNLLCQVFGTKIIRLFPPSEWEVYLYPHDADSLLFNTSQVDIEDPDIHMKFPNFPNAKYMDVLLQPGMVLYMPPKWAHFVKSLAPSFSISYWFE